MSVKHGHVLSFGVKRSSITFIIDSLGLDVSFSAGHGVSLDCLSGVATGVKLGIGSIVVIALSSCEAGFGTFLSTLCGRGVRIFRLVGTALTLGSWSCGLRGSRASRRFACEARLGRGGRLLGTALFRGFDAGSFFRVSVTAFSISRFALDCLDTDFRSCYARGSLVTIVNVFVGNTLSLRFLWGRGTDGGVKSNTVQELLLKGKPRRVGGSCISEVGEFSKLLSVNLEGAVSFTRTQQEFKPSRKQVK